MRRRSFVVRALLAAPAAVAFLTTQGAPPAKSISGRNGRRNRPVPILMYHVIDAPSPNAQFPDLYLSRRDFAAQLRWLASNGYQAVTLREVYLFWTGLRPLPKRPIVLSFDDGSRGHFTNAARLLRTRGWPGVLNLEYAHLVHGDLTGRMIRQMLADGWELDSHAMTHLDLAVVDRPTLHWEVTRSRQLLRQRFGVRVDFFCYPVGRFDARVVQAARAAGYLGATTTEPGLARPEQLFRLARIRVDSGDGPRELAKKLAALDAP